MNVKRISYLFLMIGILVLLSIPFMGLRQYYQYHKVIHSFQEQQTAYQQDAIMTEQVRQIHQQWNQEPLEDPFLSEDKSTTTIEEMTESSILITESIDQKVAKQVVNSDAFGYLELPSIKEKTLPVYMGATKTNLKKGVGHVSGTDLPLSGPGTHSVLSAHRGYYGSNLFLYIDYLQPGDLLYVGYLGEEAAYQVMGNEIISPYDGASLTDKPENDEEWLTLLTCHPVRSLDQRLLVHAKRVPYIEIKNQKKISVTTRDVEQSVDKVNTIQQVPSYNEEETFIEETAAFEVTPSQNKVVQVLVNVSQHSLWFYSIVMIIGMISVIFLFVQFMKTFKQ